MTNSFSNSFIKIIIEKFKIAAMAPKEVLVIYLGVNTLNLNFCPVTVQTAEIGPLDKVQDGHHGSNKDLVMEFG